LFIDPFAEVLGGEIGKTYLEKRKERGDSDFLSVLVDGVAVRTRKLDDEVVKAYSQDGIKQICVIGAGLDTRAWRLSNENYNIKFFEVDFPEIFEFKLQALASLNAVNQFDYRSISADMSLSDWPDSLIAQGFDVNEPTFWLLEGLIGYLTEDEADLMLQKISQVLSAKNSRLVATFLTPLTKSRNELHRFFPENPLAWVSRYGWSGVQTDIHEIGQQLGRPLLESTMEGYFIVVVDLL